MKESKLIEFSKNYIKPLSNIVKAKYSRSTYDAYNDRFVVEFKSRTVGNCIYETTVIEELKLKNNINTGKTFIYAVFNEKDYCIYYYNVSKLVKNGYNFDWELRSFPKTTYFDNKGVVSKKVGYIHWDDYRYKLNTLTGELTTNDKA